MNADTSFTMKSGTANRLQIGESGSTASIKSIQIVNNIGTVDRNSTYNATVIPAFKNAHQLLNIWIVKGSQSQLEEQSHNYTLVTKWLNAENQTEITQADSKTVKKYDAVAIATPTDSLMFIEGSVPETVKVNVDGTNVIGSVPVTSSSVDENGILTLYYAFEDMFKGGSLRLDAGDGLEKTNMRFGYSVGVAQDKFVKSSWYYGTSADNLKWSLLDGTKSAVVDGDFVSNIVFKNLPSSAYSEKVYARAIVTYKDDNGVVRSKMGAFIDSRSAVDVAKKVKEAYANNTNSKAYKHASNVLTAAGITEE